MSRRASLPFGQAFPESSGGAECLVCPCESRAVFATGCAPRHPLAVQLSRIVLATNNLRPLSCLFRRATQACECAGATEQGASRGRTSSLARARSCFPTLCHAPHSLEATTHPPCRFPVAIPSV